MANYLTPEQKKLLQDQDINKNPLSSLLQRNFISEGEFSTRYKFSGKENRNFPYTFETKSIDLILINLAYEKCKILFEDGVAIKPMNIWLKKMNKKENDYISFYETNGCLFEEFHYYELTLPIIIIEQFLFIFPKEHKDKEIKTELTNLQPIRATCNIIKIE